jgi:hypothetical protein
MIDVEVEEVAPLWNPIVVVGIGESYRFRAFRLLQRSRGQTMQSRGAPQWFLAAHQSLTMSVKPLGLFPTTTVIVRSCS